jgi:hypothetical protein
MDRVYVSKTHLTEMFFKYAAENGFWRKAHQSYSDKTQFILPDGGYTEAVFTIKTDTNFDQYPYIDTFTYGRKGELSNVKSFGFHHEYVNTNGTRDGSQHDGETWDGIAETWIDEDDARYINQGRFRGFNTHIDNTASVGNDVYWISDPLIIQEAEDQEFILLTDAAFCEIDECYYRREHVVFSQYDNSHYHEGYCVMSEQGWILEDDSVEVDGKYYHEDEAPYSAEELESMEQASVYFVPVANQFAHSLTN